MATELPPQSIHKAVVALISSIVFLAAEFGVPTDWVNDGLIAAVGTIVTPFLVWLVPNKPMDL